MSSNGSVFTVMIRK